MGGVRVLGGRGGGFASLFGVLQGIGYFIAEATHVVLGFTRVT